MKRASRIVLAAVCAGIGLAAPAAAASAGHAARTPIKHLVFLLQENHTFDNYFGTRPGVDGLPKHVCMPVHPPKPKPCVKPFHIGAQGSTDLDHNDGTFTAQYDGGRMDGFVSGLTGGNRRLAMGHYDRSDLPYYWRVADNYVLFDHFFSSVRAGSPMNHLFSVTARPPAVPTKGGEIPASGWGDNLPTIFDRLQAAGVSWKFYVQNYDPNITYRTRGAASADRASQVIWVPLLAMSRFLDDKQLSSHIVDMSQYYKDVATGHLPAVSYMVPAGDSEHPPGSVASGQTFVRGLVTELERSPVWSSSAFLWAYDDWGGWYDHVKPPSVDAYGYGFRVPALLVSPYAKRGYVDHATLDFTSVLKFIEQNWSLSPLAQRDARAASIASAFNFKAPPRSPVLLAGGLPSDAAPPAHRLPVFVIYTSTVAAVALFILVLGGRDRRRRRQARERRARAARAYPVRGVAR